MATWRTMDTALSDITSKCKISGWLAFQPWCRATILSSASPSRTDSEVLQLSRAGHLSFIISPAPKRAASYPKPLYACDARYVGQDAYCLHCEPTQTKNPASTVHEDTAALHSVPVPSSHLYSRLAGTCGPVESSRLGDRMRLSDPACIPEEPSLGGLHTLHVPAKRPPVCTAAPP